MDGANALHAHGRMVMVQQPEPAQFAGMPETAIAGDDPDAILPPKKLAQMLMTHLKVAPALVELPEEKEDMLPQAFGRQRNIETAGKHLLILFPVEVVKISAFVRRDCIFPIQTVKGFLPLEDGRFFNGKRRSNPRYQK